MEHESIEEGIVVMFTLVSLVLPDMTSSKTTQSNNQTVESPTKKFRIKRKKVTEWKPVHWIFLHQMYYVLIITNNNASIFVLSFFHFFIY